MCEYDQIVANNIAVIKNAKVTYRVVQQKLWRPKRCKTHCHIHLLHISKVKKDSHFHKSSKQEGRDEQYAGEQSSESIPLSYFGVALTAPKYLFDKIPNIDRPYCTRNS